MEIAASVEGRPRRRERRNGGGRFRAEIEMDWGLPSIPRGPSYGFVAAVREPLVRLQRPKFDFEMWDWGYFTWPHDRLDANLEMRDSDPDATLEADRKASDSFLNQSTQLLERYAIVQDIQEQYAAAWPHEQLDGANLESRDSDPGGALGPNRSTLQLEGYAMGQYTHERNAIALPCNQHNVRDCNRKRKIKVDLKASESLFSRSALQLKRREMDQDHQHTQEQRKESEHQTSLLLDENPVGRRSPRRRRGCAEANGFLDHGTTLQGSWAW